MSWAELAVGALWAIGWVELAGYAVLAGAGVGPILGALAFAAVLLGVHWPSSSPSPSPSPSSP